VRVLVTGGAGYIGQFCVRRLLESGHAVTILDRRPVPPGLRGNAAAIRGELSDEAMVERVLRDGQIEAVLHLAGDKSVADAMVQPGPHLRNNVCGTISLLEAMRRARVTRIVFSSSAAVYGTPEKLPVTEDALLRPENPYGSSKVMIEQILLWYHVCHELDSVSLRYFNAAGAADDCSIGEDPAAAPNLVPRVMEALIDRADPLQVFGTDFPTFDGTAIRDYVHVEDLARAHVLALAHLASRRGTEVLNLGTGKGSSVLEVIRAAEAAAGRPVPFQLAPRRNGDPAAVWADTTKANEILGWRAERDLDDIVRTAWAWHAKRGVDQARTP